MDRDSIVAGKGEESRAFLRRQAPTRFTRHVSAIVYIDYIVSFFGSRATGSLCTTWLFLFSLLRLCIYSTAFAASSSRSRSCRLKR